MSGLTKTVGKWEGLTDVLSGERTCQMWEKDIKWDTSSRLGVNVSVNISVIVWLTVL